MFNHRSIMMFVMKSYDKKTITTKFYFDIPHTSCYYHHHQHISFTFPLSSLSLHIRITHTHTHAQQLLSL
eukprot:UN01363